jgi:hypothetical protein
MAFGLKIYGPTGDVWMDTSDSTWFHTANVGVTVDATNFNQTLGKSSVGFNKIALINLINTAPDNQEGYTPTVTFSTGMGQDAIGISNSTTGNKNQPCNILVADSNMSSANSGQTPWIELSDIYIIEEFDPVGWNSSTGLWRSPDAYKTKSFTMPTGVTSIKIKLAQHRDLQNSTTGYDVAEAYFTLEDQTGTEVWNEGNSLGEQDWITHTTSSAISVTAGNTYTFKCYAPQDYNQYDGMKSSRCMGNITIVDPDTGATMGELHCFYQWWASVPS